MKDIEIISNLTTLRVKVFTHNDLDGVSCALAFKKLYSGSRVTFNFEFIGYSDYNKIKEFFDVENELGAKAYDYLFITDLNLKNNEFYDKIYEPFRKFTTQINDLDKNRTSIFKKIFIIDHHKDSEDTLRYRVEDLFPKIEYYNDMTFCASMQVYNFIVNRQSREWVNATIGCEHKNYEDRSVWLKSYLKHINDWDLFEWKQNGNMVARDLNLLFTHLKRSKFFFMQEQKEGLAFYFNKTENTIIKETLETIEKEYQRALMTSVVLDHIDENGFPHPDMQYIVIRSDDNISIICDMIKEAIIRKEIYKMFNIKYIVNVSFKYGSINFRRVLDDIDLTKIANIYGGGGHPFASGAVLDGKNRLQLDRIIMPTLEKYGESLK